MAKEKQTKVTDFIQDDHNFNKGTEQGEELIAKSFRELGAGRSILVDKNNRIIAGNKSQKAALEAGIENARIIESDGNELIVVKRTDIDLDSAKGRKLALADNMTNKINLDIDEEEIEKLSAELDGFNPEEWGVDFDVSWGGGES